MHDQHPITTGAGTAAVMPNTPTEPNNSIHSSLYYRMIPQNDERLALLQQELMDIQ